MVQGRFSSSVMPSSIRALSDFLCSSSPLPLLHRLSSHRLSSLWQHAKKEGRTVLGEVGRILSGCLHMSGGRIILGCPLILVALVEERQEVEGN